MNLRGILKVSVLLSLFFVFVYWYSIMITGGMK